MTIETSRNVHGRDECLASGSRSMEAGRRRAVRTVARRFLLSTTAIVGINLLALAVLMPASPALADGGAGGAGNAGTAGGAAGADAVSGAGGNGVDGTSGTDGGGGGGAGATGGTGGQGINLGGAPTAGGTGGAGAGANGGAGGNGDGTNNAGGGGGGGGAHGDVLGVTSTPGSLSGGIGGAGGDGDASGSTHGGGGGGGGGGYGVSLTATGITLNVNNGVTIAGGAGGAGGAGAVGTVGGAGGGGGIGVFMGDGNTLNLTGAIVGGAGGAGGAANGGTAGTAGVDGAGVVGSNLTIVQSVGGTIAGGGTANAVTLTAGVNAITFAGATSGLTGNINVTGTLQLNAAAGGTTVSNIISGAGGIIQDSANTLTLTGVNTYTGATTINTGTLELSGGAALSDSSAVTLANVATAQLSVLTNETIGSLAGGGTTGGNVVITAGQTLTVGGDNTSTTYAGIISDTAVAGALTKVGTGTQTLTGANTYRGLTTISAGALNIQNATGLGTIAVGTTVASGAALELEGGIVVGAEALTLSGTGVSSGGALRNISGANSYAGAITLAAASRINSDAGTLTLTGGVTGAFGLTLGGAGNGVESGVIATGAGTVTKDGTGTWTLSGANTYTGLTTISAGTLALSGGAALSDSSAVTLANVAGAQLSVLTSETIGSLAGGGATGGNVVITAGQTLSAGADNTSTTYAGVISQTAASGALTKVGTGTLTLTGANTYTGATTISAGTLALSGGAALSDSSAVTLANVAGAQLSVLTSETIGSLAGGGATGGNVVITAGQTLSAGADNTSTTYAGVISQTAASGAFTKVGTGTLTLTGANTYTGGTTVSVGTLVVAAAGSITSNVGVSVGAIFTNNGTVTGGVTNAGTGSNTGTINGGVGNSGGFTNSNSITGNATNTGTFGNSGTIGGSVTNSLTFTNSGTVTNGLTNNAAGTYTQTAGTTNGPVANSGTVNTSAGAFGGAITNTGAFNVTNDTAAQSTFANNGTGTLSVSNTATFAITGALTNTSTAAPGVTVATGRTLTAASVSNSAGSTILNQGTVGGGLTNAGTYNQTVAGANNATTNGGTTNTGTINATGAVGFANSFNGTVANNSTANFNVLAEAVSAGVFNNAGTARLNVTGGNFSVAGALTNTSTNALAVNVSSGRILNATSLTSSAGTVSVFGTVNGDVTINGGTLLGTGTVNNNVTINAGGILAPGASPGTLTINGNLALAAGSTTNFELGTANTVAGTTNDLLQVGGTLDLGGTLNVASAVSGYYRLINYGGALLSNSATVSATGGTASLLTTIAGQINVSIANGGQQVQYWDGADIDGAALTGSDAVDGGNGNWTAANTNWTTGPTLAGINDQWRSGLGVFAGTAGTVTVTGTQSFEGLQFSTDGYTVTGDTLQMTGNPVSAGGNGTQSFINVDTGVSATIASVLSGSAADIGLEKLGAGSLTLSGANTYSGGTSLSAGTLVLANNAALGTGSLAAVAGTTVGYGDGVSIANAVTATGGVTFDQASGAATQAGTVGGTGSLTKTGAGSLTFSSLNGAFDSFSAAGGTTVATNSGTIGSVASPGSVVAQSGTLTFNNLGTVTGTIGSQAGGTLIFNNISSDTLALTPGSISTLVDNNGVLNNPGRVTFSGNTEIAGLQSFDNSGTIVTTGGNLRLTGIGTFTNSGTINLQNGAIGDSVTINGNFVAAQTGSTVLVDIDLSKNGAGGAPISDQLVVTGNASGGQTVINFNNISGGRTVLLSGPVNVVSLGSNTGSGFVATGLPTTGIVNYTLVSDANGQLVLQSNLKTGSAGGVIASISSSQALIASALSRPSSSFVSTPFQPEPNSTGAAPWIRTIGGTTNSSTDSTVTNGAIASTSGTGVDLDYAGVQGGFDVGRFNIDGSNWNVNLGVTGGYNSGLAKQAQAGGTNKTEFDTKFVGTYLAFSHENFFGEVQARWDYTSFKISAPDFFSESLKTDSDRYSVSGSTGYSFDLGNGASFVPSVGLSYSLLTTDTIVSASEGNIAFDDRNSIIGYASGTLAKTIILGDKTSAIQPFITGTIYNDFGDDAKATFTDQVGSVSTIVSDKVGTYGEASLGLNYRAIFEDNKLGIKDATASVRGDVNMGNDIQGSSITGNLRLQF